MVSSQPMILWFSYRLDRNGTMLKSPKTATELVKIHSEGAHLLCYTPAFLRDENEIFILWNYVERA